MIRPANRVFACILMACFSFSTLEAQDTSKQSSQSLFNGKDLSGWRGDPKHWSVVNGVIQGKTTSRGEIKRNTFLIYEKPFADFELTLKYKILSGNSGVQYRAKVRDEKSFSVIGYQADIDSGIRFSGILYEEGGRGIVATRGQQVTVKPNGKKDVLQNKGAAELQSAIHSLNWNDYRIVANGQRLQHFINGQLMADVTDQQTGKRADTGVIALQLHAGPAMQVLFKDISIKTIPRTAPKTHPKTKDFQALNDQDQVDLKNLPKWIWHRDAQAIDSAVFVKSFEAKPGQKAVLRGTCDNEMQVLLNGKEMVSSSQWERPVAVDISEGLVAGKNELRVQAKDHGGIAALALSVTIAGETLVTDESWKTATPEEAQKNQWAKPIVVGEVGASSLPWRHINASTFKMKSTVARNTGANQKAVAASDVRLPKGFRAELVYSVPKSTQGSWVAITTDDKGRLYTSDQGRKGMFRVTPAKLDDPQSVTKVEELNIPVSGAQGMCWAHDSLYVNAYGSGVWRIQDSDGDDQLDTAENIIRIANGGEHGMHAVIETEDGEGIYFLAGNHSPAPKFESSRAPTNWGEDLLLPRNWDPRGHARGKLAPGGWIARCNPDGSNIEIVSIGYRNQYDIALNRNGEMFTYDADMEWDTGTPWYRPTRVCHVTSGSEFGWRSGSGKWPAYFEDSVPSVVDIGPGSPTGVVFGTGAKFPARYQDALFILDWTFGTIYAIHPQANGATYSAKKETFAWAKPLPVTDAIVGNDGAFYFTTGGRGADSSLYRITYVGSEATDALEGPIVDAGAESRKLRRELEDLHHPDAKDAIAKAWPQLSSQDRAIRYAARLAVEHQPVASWRERALNESNPQSHILAMIALARQGSSTDLAPIMESLFRLDMGALSKTQKLAALRAYSLAFTRLGAPGEDLRKRIIEKLDPRFPEEDEQINTELARLLIYLDSPSVVAKTMKLIENLGPTQLPDWAELAKRNDNYGQAISNMLGNMPPLQSIQYAYMLRNTKTGWTPQLRKSYFGFFGEFAKKSGGPSYSGYLSKAREDAMATLTPSEKHQLSEVLGLPLVAPAVESTPPKGPGRKWTTTEAVAVVGKQLKNRDFEKGQNLFHALNCSKCHYFAGSGGAIGPDLTSVANKFSTRDLLEAIVEPSKVISDQYGSKTILDLDGNMATGLAIEEEDRISVYSHDPAIPPTVFKKENIDEIKDSDVSQMPLALIDSINEEELRDLVAFLKSGGNQRNRMFRKQ